MHLTTSATPPLSGTTRMAERRLTRRDNQRKARRQRAATRLRATVAIVAAALLIAPYAVVPFVTSSAAAASTHTTMRPVQGQLLAVPDDAMSTPLSERGDYMVTQVLPGQYRPYSSTADTFVNDPTSSVQWPFTQGVPIRTWFSGNHTGLDINPGVGTPVQAIADGVVIETGNPSGTYGVYAILEHTINGQKVTSLYAHMQEGSLAVDVGDTVTVGQLVGQVGSSGRSTGAHLHLSVRVEGELVDPYTWLTQAAQASPRT